MSHGKTNRYYEDLWELDNTNAQRQWDHQVEVNNEKRDYDERVADYHDLNNQNKWNHEYQMRAFNYATQMEAYNKSIDLANKGFDLNRRHAELSLEAQARVSFERKQKLEFEMQASLIKYRTNHYKMAQTKGLLQQKQNAEHAKHMMSSIEAVSKLVQKTGKVIGRGQAGRSATKLVGAIEAEYGRMEAAKSHLILMSDHEYQTKMHGQNFAMAALGMGRKYQMKAEAATYESILDAHEKSVAEILLKKESADLQTESRKMLQPKLAPMIPGPQAVPRTTIFDPPAPIKTPKPPEGDKEHGFAYRGGGGGIGAVQQGGFNVGGAMMQGGSLMAAAGGAAAAGTFGAGMTGLSVLGPIGIGIAVVGFLGSVFDLW